MIEILSDKWVFLSLLALALAVVFKLLNDPIKVDKTLEDQYKKLLTSEEHKVK
mgnify:CR=1 FL=1